MTMSARRFNPLGSLPAIGAILIVAGCSAAGGTLAPSSTATTPPTPIVVASPTVAPTASPTTAPSSSVAPAASNVLAAEVFGDGDYPGFAVDAPGGWTTNGAFILHPESISGISVWDVAQIPRDPCHWKDSLEDAGDTVDEVVAALTKQATRNASTPTDVTLAGHKGRYLEWSVPADAVVSGDADFAGCDSWPDNGHLDFVSWLSGKNGDHGERYQQEAGQVDRLWVLDVDGQTLVVDAVHDPQATSAHIAEQTKIVESLRFVSP